MILKIKGEREKEREKKMTYMDNVRMAKEKA